MRAEYIPQKGVNSTLKQYSDSLVGIFTYFQYILAILIVNDIVLAFEDKSCEKLRYIIEKNHDTYCEKNFTPLWINSTKDVHTRKCHSSKD